MNRSNLLSAVIGAAVALIAGFGGLTLFNRTQPAPIVIQPAPPTAAPTPSPTPGPLTVYVNGAVRQPGLYTLPAGSRVAQAVEAAGGLTTAAFGDGLNLAAPLSDGAQVFVPSQEQAERLMGQLLSAPVRSGSADVGGNSAGGETAALIDLNRANAAELERLPGVGPATARSILNYREEVGLFQTIEDVMNVSGIGPAKFEQMRPYITVTLP